MHPKNLVAREIERWLLVHPEVAAAVVVTEADGTGLVAWVQPVVCDREPWIMFRRLRAHLAEQVPPEYVPRRFIRTRRIHAVEQWTDPLVPAETLRPDGDPDGPYPGPASLDLLRAYRELGDLLDADVPAVTMFQYPTIESSGRPPRPKPSGAA